MSRTPATEAIAILIELAQNGEIDPWDVQVIEIIDRFLSELGLIGEKEPNYEETDLVESGQTFLWASMLVLLKADTLEKMQQEEEIEEEEINQEIENDDENNHNGLSTLPKSLENHIHRRSSKPPMRKRRVTLQELIHQIQQIATEIEKTSTRKTTPKLRSNSPSQIARNITQLAHDENLTQVATSLEEFLRFKLPLPLPEETDIDYEKLLEWWNQSQGKYGSQPHDRVGIFWALLLLSAQSKVELSQNEFYCDLKIKLLPQVTEEKLKLS